MFSWSPSSWLTRLGSTGVWSITRYCWLAKLFKDLVDESCGCIVISLVILGWVPVNEFLTWVFRWVSKRCLTELYCSFRAHRCKDRLCWRWSLFQMSCCDIVVTLFSVFTYESNGISKLDILWFKFVWAIVWSHSVGRLVLLFVLCFVISIVFSVEKGVMNDNILSIE